MKKITLTVTFLVAALLTGCGSDANQDTYAVDSLPQSVVTPENVDTDSAQETMTLEEGASGETENTSALPNLAIRFGETEDRPVYEISLEDNEVSLRFVRVLQEREQTIPIYVFDGSENTDVLQYYDIPERYEIPDGEPSLVESEQAGEVYYSAPGRIMIFFRDGEVAGDYVKVGTVTNTEGLEDAVSSNPLDSWGNKRVMLSIAE